MSSPFTPGVPVPVEFFEGRQEQIQLLLQKVAGAHHRSPQIAFLTGERGIGKTSLAGLLRVLAEQQHNMIAVHTHLGGVTSLQQMVRKVFDRLIKDSVSKPWYEKAKEIFGKHVREEGLFGLAIKFDASEEDLTGLVDGFAPALSNLMEQMKDDVSGIVLILDDINGLAAEPLFANWLKSFIDEVATSSKPMPLCLILVGLDERRHELIASQPSLARTFDIVELSAWSEDETAEFYRGVFDTVGIEVAEEALETMVTFSGGLPVLAHEIGEAAFKLDTEGRISTRKALMAISIAADNVGHKMIEPQVFDAIRSAHYRSILRKLAAHTG